VGPDDRCRGGPLTWLLYPGINGIAVCQLDARPVIVVATEDGISWWDPITGGEPYLEANVSTVWAVAALTSPEVVTVFGAAHGQPWPVYRWDAWSGRQMPPVGHHDICIIAVTAAPLPGRSLVASGDEAGCVHCWDASTAAEAGPPLDAHETTVLALAINSFRDGRALLTSGSADGDICRWDPFTGQLVGRRLSAHTGPIISLCATAIEGREQLISTGGDGTVRRWDANTGELLDDSLTGYCATVWTTNRTTMIAAAGTHDDTVTIHQLTT
jgi:WD40 repeat protein